VDMALAGNGVLLLRFEFDHAGDSVLSAVEESRTLWIYFFFPGFREAIFPVRDRLFVWRCCSHDSDQNAHGAGWAACFGPGDDGSSPRDWRHGRQLQNPALASVQ